MSDRSAGMLKLLANGLCAARCVSVTAQPVTVSHGIGKVEILGHFFLGLYVACYFSAKCYCPMKAQKQEHLF